MSVHEPKGFTESQDIKKYRNNNLYSALQELSCSRPAPIHHMIQFYNPDTDATILDLNWGTLVIAEAHVLTAVKCEVQVPSVS